MDLSKQDRRRQNMARVLDDRNDVVSVGTYVNDALTIDEVQRVEVPHPGPTCKADCRDTPPSTSPA
jgi:hypothetical protein